MTTTTTDKVVTWPIRWLTGTEEELLIREGDDYARAALLRIYELTGHSPSCRLQTLSYCLDCAGLGSYLSKKLRSEGMEQYPDGLLQDVEEAGYPAVAPEDSDHK